MVSTPMIGACELKYTTTRPKICYGVNQNFQLSSQPLEEHKKLIKKILRYLKGSVHYGLLLKPTLSSQRLLLTFSELVMRASHLTQLNESQPLAYFPV